MVENVLSLKFQNPNLGSVNFRLHMTQIYIKIVSIPGFAQCMCTENGEKVVHFMLTMILCNEKWVTALV